MEIEITPGGVAEWFRQGPAKPRTAVRFRSPPLMGNTFTRGLTLHARLYDVVCGWEEARGLLEWRRKLVGDITGEVLEIGTGTGRNLPYYPAGARVLASEFDPVMLARAPQRAVGAAADVTFMLADAMKLPLRAASVDTVVIGLALCSIPDPRTALEEAKRVLRPGGTLRFVEHVRDDDGTFRARVQDALNPAWRFVSGGCNCNRRTEELVGRSGFRLVDVDRFKVGFPLLAPHVHGRAVT